ncbi:hypothetical protein IQ265_20530 [Nodosilinea sp. LEGE 06152]|nr:hypothetical protein [Nodosilinea sp. LEGE 06152]
MEPSIVVAIVAGSVTAIGWMVNHVLTDHREREKRQTEASLKYVEKQLEELYGPLAFLLYEGRQTFQDLLDTLGRNYVFMHGNSLSKEDLKTWLFWAEYSFLPKNEKIRELLVCKTHLIEGSRFPESYVTFLNHHSSWFIQHQRWKEESVAYSWHSKINWPIEFEQEIIQTFERLKAKHSALLGKLTQIK